MLSLFQVVAALAFFCAMSQAPYSEPLIQCDNRDYSKRDIVANDCDMALYQFMTSTTNSVSTIVYQMTEHTGNCHSCAVRLYTQNGAFIQADKSSVDSVLAKLSNRCGTSPGSAVVPYGTTQRGLGDSLLLSVSPGDGVHCH